MTAKAGTSNSNKPHASKKRTVDGAESTSNRRNSASSRPAMDDDDDADADSTLAEEAAGEVKKFTPSCSRCRAKKLKCDTQQPCSNCLAKGLQSECRKDERMPRGRKRPKPDKSSVRLEIIQLRKRLEELGDMLAIVPSPHGSPEPETDSAPTQAFQFSSPSSSSPPPPPPGGRSKHPRIDHRTAVNAGASLSACPSSHPLDAEAPTRLLENWTSLPQDSSSAAQTVNAVEVARSEPWRTDVASAYWSNPSHLQTRVELSREANQLLPDPLIVQGLIDAYFRRCHHLVGNIVFEPRYRRLSAMAYKMNLSTEELFTSPVFVDPAAWANLYLVLDVALGFFPYESREPTETFRAVNDFRRAQGSAWSDKAHDLCKRCLALHEVLNFTSLPAIQAVCLMVFRAKENDAFNRQLLRMAISSAQSLGYHKLGTWSLEEEPDIEMRCRRETICRVWAHLSSRDWFSSARDLTYMVQPLQCDSRPPLNITDQDLLHGVTEATPMATYTPMAYSLLMLSLSRIVREISDARVFCQKGLDQETKEIFKKRLLRWLWALPPAFQMDSTVSSPLVIAVLRWMIHHQAFHQLLKLCRGDFSQRQSREGLMDLAHSVLMTQTRVSSVCPIVQGMWVNWLHLFNAGLIVGFDLLDTSKGMHTEQKRMAARNKIMGSMQPILQSSGSNKASLVLSALLELEDRRYTDMAKGRTVEQLDLSRVATQLIREAASRTSEPLSQFASFRIPDRGHDAILPALTQSAIGTGQADVIRVEDWQLIALENGIDSRMRDLVSASDHSMFESIIGPSVRPWIPTAQSSPNGIEPQPESARGTASNTKGHPLSNVSSASALRNAYTSPPQSSSRNSGDGQQISSDDSSSNLNTNTNASGSGQTSSNDTSGSTPASTSSGSWPNEFNKGPMRYDGTMEASGRYGSAVQSPRGSSGHQMDQYANTGKHTPRLPHLPHLLSPPQQLSSSSPRFSLPNQGPSHEARASANTAMSPSQRGSYLSEMRPVSPHTSSLYGSHPYQAAQYQQPQNEHQRYQHQHQLPYQRQSSHSQESQYYQQQPQHQPASQYGQYSHSHSHSPPLSQHHQHHHQHQQQQQQQQQQPQQQNVSLPSMASHLPPVAGQLQYHQHHLQTLPFHPPNAAPGHGHGSGPGAAV